MVVASNDVVNVCAFCSAEYAVVFVSGYDLLSNLFPVCGEFLFAFAGLFCPGHYSPPPWFLA